MCTDKSWKRILLTFSLIFLVIFIGGVLLVNSLSDIVDVNNLHPEVVTVVDKNDTNFNDEYYLVHGDNNKTYSILMNDDYDVRIFNNLEIGKKYKLIIKEPTPLNNIPYPNIIQVYNVTG